MTSSPPKFTDPFASTRSAPSSRPGTPGANPKSTTPLSIPQRAVTPFPQPFTPITPVTPIMPPRGGWSPRHGSMSSASSSAPMSRQGSISGSTSAPMSREGSVSGILSPPGYFRGSTMAQKSEGVSTETVDASTHQLRAAVAALDDQIAAGHSGQRRGSLTPRFQDEPRQHRDGASTPGRKALSRATSFASSMRERVLEQRDYAISSSHESTHEDDEYSSWREGWAADWKDQRSYWSSPIAKDWVKWQLIFVTFTTSLLDVATYTDFGVFCSYQTGNTLLLFIGLAGGPATEYIAIIQTCVSLASFLIAGFIFGQIVAMLPRGPRTRWWMIFCAFAQALPVFIPAILADRGIFPLQDHAPKASQADKYWHLVMILSGASGIQMAIARSVDCPSIPTALITTTYSDLLADSHLLYPLMPYFGFQPDREMSAKARHKRLAMRTLRLCYLMSFISGTILGAFFRRHSPQPSDILYLSGAMRVLAAFTYFLNRTERPKVAPPARTPKIISPSEKSPA